MHKLVQYFQSLYTCRNEDIYALYALKGVHIANFEGDLCSSNVEYRSLLFHYYVILPYKVKRTLKIGGRNTLYM